MTARSREAVRQPESGPARLVLDVETALDEATADRLRVELTQRGRAHVVLLLPRLGWSTDAALVALHSRRIARASEQRLQELAWIAGPRGTHVTVPVQRHPWWRRSQPGQHLSRYDTQSLTPEGPVR